MITENLIDWGRRTGARLARTALPMAAGAVRRGARGARNAGRRLASSRLMTRARASVGRGIHRADVWVRRHPYALPLIALGGTSLALLGLRQPAGRKTSPAGGLGALLRRLAVSVATPRVIRTVTIRW